jgi:hypothetical protein
MKPLLRAFRDWWRGYSDADWEYAKFVFTRKPSKPGEVFPLSASQFKAYIALCRAMYC